MAPRKSFPASRPQLTPPPPSTVLLAQSHAPVRPSQRSTNAKGKKGKGKASPPKGNVSVSKTSRHLTHEEIWDDSTLVDVWEAAMDEYRVSSIPPTMAL